MAEYSLIKNTTLVPALKAFWLREFRVRFGSFRLGYAWAIIEPLYQVMIFTVLHAVIRGPGHDLYGASPAVFMLYGVITWLAFQHAVGQARGSIKGNRGLFGYRQIKPIDITIVRVGIEFLIMTVAYFVLLFAAFWLGFAPQIPNFLLIGY